ncbi:hypothetical protein ACFLRM_01950 [Acidobacteriota bacterium]
MQEYFRYGVIFAFFISFFSLSFLVLRTFRFGKKTLYSKPQGKPIKGICYAFGQGMMPWAKESVLKHIPTFISGILYHIGIFLALFYTLSLAIPFNIPGQFLFSFQIIFLMAVICGLFLLLRRIIKTTLWQISCPDDFVSNILVNLFLVMALIDVSITKFRAYLFIAVILMLLYIPFGKIRHCFFFFFSRVFFGHFFGRRGVLS